MDSTDILQKLREYIAGNKPIYSFLNGISFKKDPLLRNMYDSIYDEVAKYQRLIIR